MQDNVPLSAVEQVPARVLLLEDDAILSLNASMMLSEMGVTHISSAGSVAHALALMDEQEFDFGVLDFILGDEETCLPVAKRLCAAHVPVLITTGLLDLDLPEDCRSAQILGKPYRFADLQRRITRPPR